MTRYINWDGKQAVTTEDPDLDALCVIDTNYDQNSSLRYGSFTHGCWNYIPLANFPVEFKVALLLLRVSP